MWQNHSFWDAPFVILNSAVSSYSLLAPANPYSLTDTTAALRASEIRADVILKATKVDGVYDRDPKKHPDARRFDQLTFSEALSKRLQVMESLRSACAWTTRYRLSFST